LRLSLVPRRDDDEEKQDEVTGADSIVRDGYPPCGVVSSIRRGLLDSGVCR
jgi:hypothetical protein